MTREHSHSEEPDYITIGFERIGEDLQFVVGCFREVLEELGQTSIGRHLPWSGAPPILNGEQFPTKLGQAYSITFQLLNMIEEGAAQAMRDLRESSAGLTAEQGLWGDCLSSLRNGGVSETQIAAILPDVCVEPVLTAHPTEAKRLTVLEQHRALYVLLSERHDRPLTPTQRDAHRGKVKAALERL